MCNKISNSDVELKYKW
uniref:Uncharacterized protein n=1 Tax=Arundo donax TaxID=35708 RepID=A0A0A9A1Y9_ARUDO